MPRNTHCFYATESQSYFICINKEHWKPKEGSYTTTIVVNNQVQTLYEQGIIGLPDLPSSQFVDALKTIFEKYQINFEDVESTHISSDEFQNFETEEYNGYNIWIFSVDIEYAKKTEFHYNFETPYIELKRDDLQPKNEIKLEQIPLPNLYDISIDLFKNPPQVLKLQTEYNIYILKQLNP